MLVPWNMFKPSSNILTDSSKAVLHLLIFVVICVFLSHTLLSVSCSLVFTCWGRLTSWLSCSVLSISCSLVVTCWGRLTSWLSCSVLSISCSLVVTCWGRLTSWLSCSVLSIFAALWSPAGEGWPLGSLVVSCLFFAALWSPAGEGLTSWLSCMWCFRVFCHFPIRCPGSGVVLDCINSRSS